MFRKMERLILAVLLAVLVAGCATEKTAQSPAHGTVVVRFIVNEQGEVEDVQVVSSTHPSFVAAAVASVQKWRFKPGMKDGRPAKLRMEQAVEFDLEDGPNVATPTGKK